MHQDLRNQHPRIASTGIDGLIFGRKQFCHVKINISSDISFHAWLRFVFMIHWLSTSYSFTVAVCTLRGCSSVAAQLREPDAGTDR